MIDASRIVVLHTPIEAEGPVSLEPHPSGAALVRASGCSADWWHPGRYNTKAGFLFERQIVECILDAVSGWVEPDRMT